MKKKKKKKPQPGVYKTHILYKVTKISKLHYFLH